MASEEPTAAQRLTKTQKFVRVIEALQTPEGMLTDELMERFALDDRTLRRYTVDLVGLGIPLHVDGRGTNRRMRIDPSYQRRGIQLSLLELVSLRFGRELFNFLEGTGFAQDMDDALERFSRLSVDLPHNQLAQELDRKFIAVPEHHKDHTRDREIIEEIVSALLWENPADCHYAKVGGTTRPYVLHPYTLAVYRQGLYLFAFDVEEARVKTFAVDRFRHFERRRGERFDYPDDYDPDALYSDAFGIIVGPVHEVVLEFRRRAAPYIRERVWHHSQQVEPAAEGGALLTMRVGLTQELVSWVMSFGPDVMVWEPVELAERVRQLHAEAAGIVEPGVPWEGPDMVPS